MLAPTPATTSTRFDPLVTSAAVGSAVVGGVFAAFSTVVMPAVVRLGTERAIRTMQSINRGAVKPPFMIPFMGTAALSAGLGLRSLSRRDPVTGFACACYLANFAITAAYHVPRNDKLQSMAAESTAAAAYWAGNVGGWTRMNHLRAALALAATVAFAVRRRAAATPPA